jgi:hypothetical protein
MLAGRVTGLRNLVAAMLIKMARASPNPALFLDQIADLKDLGTDVGGGEVAKVLRVYAEAEVEFMVHAAKAAIEVEG